MPSRPPSPCLHPGCGVLVYGGRCELHARQRQRETGFNKKKLSRHERGYGYQWTKIRAEVLRRDGGLCQPCLKAGRPTAANIADHKIPKGEGGTDDYDNLQAICKTCHTVKTAAESARGGRGAVLEPDWLPKPAVPVHVVCGPPGSGKTTYVREHAGRGDLVLDLDVIASELFTLPLYAADADQTKAAIRYRNKMLASLGAKDCSYAQAWLIVTAGTDGSREFWRSKYTNLVVMRTPKEECIRRVREDPRRPDNDRRRAIEAILAWG